MLYGFRAFIANAVVKLTSVYFWEFLGWSWYVNVFDVFDTLIFQLVILGVFIPGVLMETAMGIGMLVPFFCTKPSSPLFWIFRHVPLYIFACVLACASDSAVPASAKQLKRYRVHAFLRRNGLRKRNRGCSDYVHLSNDNFYYLRVFQALLLSYSKGQRSDEQKIGMEMKVFNLMFLMFRVLNTSIWIQVYIWRQSLKIKGENL